MDNPKRAMTDEQKFIVCMQLYALWKQIPHLRLGQLINNTFSHNDPHNADQLWTTEDFVLIKKVQKFIEYFNT